MADETETVEVETQQDATPPQDAASSAPMDWRSALPEDVKRGVEKFSSVEALATGYVNAAKMIGGDKVPLPKSEDDWEQWFKAGGRPDTPAEYEFSLPEDMPEGFYNQDSAEWFKAEAHKAGLNKKQAEEIHGKFVENMLSKAQETETERQQRVESATAQLKSEWGSSFDRRLLGGEKTLEQYGGEEFAGFLKETGLNHDPRMIKFLANVAVATQGETGLVGVGDNSFGPADYDTQIREFTERNNAALMDKMHPDHERVVKQRFALFELKHKS